MANRPQSGVFTLPGPDAEQSPLVPLLGIILFILISGGLVFSFGLSLRDAVTVQNRAGCRELRPDARTGQAPAFTIKDLAGEDVSLADFRGKFVVLNFWATWCEPCITEWPQLARLAERFAERSDVVVLAVSVDKDVSEVNAFLNRMQLQDSGVRVLWDPEEKLNKTYGSEKLPDTFFIGRDGELLQVFVNTREWGRPAAYRCVESMADR
ncbi:MAG: peroxiredoxin family protein [Nannocystaceae bacterium]